jgi:hypothetical protein
LPPRGEELYSIMVAARIALLLALALCTVVGTSAACAQSTAPSSTGEATTTPVGTTVDEKLAQIDQALAEMQAKLSELEALKAELAKQPAAPPAQPKAERWKYSGYAQLQAFAGPAAVATGSDLQFQVRRFYHNFTYEIDSKTQAAMTLNTALAKAGSRVVPLNVYIERTEGDARIRFGQFIPPASLDLIRSSSVRHSHDYARAYNVLFPEQYEPGIMVSSYSANSHAGQVSVSLMTGNGVNNPDNDNGKNLIVSYVQPFANGKGKANLSYISGSFTTTPTDTTVAPVTTPKRLVSCGVGYATGGWEFQVEGVAGQAFGAGVRGGYAEAAYTTGRHTLYGRYDVYDPNRSTVGDSWVGPTLGYEYNWSAKHRLSFEAGLFRNGATTASDVRYEARWQVKW